MYSLSTCWNSSRHTDGREMLLEIRDLGFEYAELSHGIRISLMPGILEAVSKGEIKISTLHNFCPLPIGINHAAPNIFKFTSTDRREQENAYRYTLKTLETASRLGAKLVVLHLGAIDMRDYTDTFIDMLGEGLKDTAKWEKTWATMASKRDSRKERYIDLANQMLKKLEEEASRLGILLGVENREALEEIPLEEDFFMLFQEFNGPTVRYWHDCGHAQIKENLGAINHALHLESMAEKLAGFHIHDVQFPGRDHCSPGSGMINFESLKHVVQPHHIKVLELAPGMPTESVKKGYEHIRSIWGNE